MENIHNSPPPLKRKLFLTALAGLLCLLIGISMCIFAKDRIMLFLSCVGIIPKPLRKFRKIRIMDDEGNESALLLPKQSKVTIGDRYRFYFKQTQRISLGSEYFDAAMSSDCFLGYEQIGEIAAEP